MSAIISSAEKAKTATSIPEVKKIREGLIEHLEGSHMSEKNKRLALGVFHSRIRKRVEELRSSPDGDAPDTEKQPRGISRMVHGGISTLEDRRGTTGTVGQKI